MRKLCATAFIASALVAMPALTQDRGGAPQGASQEKAEQTGNSGPTNSSEDKPGMLILEWVNFAILVGVLGWLAAKYSGPYFAARAKAISEGLAAGEKAKADAAARAKSVEERLANLEKEIGELRSKARAEREREADRIRRDTSAEITRIHAHAEQEIEAAGKQARVDVQRFAAKLAIDLAEHKIRSGMSGEVQAALVDRFGRDLADGPARAKAS